MRGFFLIAAVLALAACKPAVRVGAAEAFGADEGKAACTRAGGQYASFGGGTAQVCVRVPRDAGKACDTADDCQSACLARSRSCAPMMPLLGCNDILTRFGDQVTECVQ